jgi:O-antigen ligase
MTDLDLVKNLFSKQNIIITLFAFFMGAFLFASSAQGHRLIFFSLVVIPFFILHKNQFFQEKKSLLLLLSSLLIALFALSLSWSTFEIDSRVDKSLLKVISTYLFVHISYYCFSQKKWIYILNFFVICAVIVGIISLFQFYQNHNFANDRLRNTVHDLHPSITANYFLFALVIVCFQLDKFKTRIGLSLALTAIALFFLSNIILTHSRGSLLGLIICGAAFTLVRNYRYFLLFVFRSTLSIFGYCLVEPVLFEKLILRGDSGRFHIYRILIERVSENQLFGLGLLADQSIYFSKTFTSVHTHSIYLASYYHLGLVGLSTHLAILLVAIYQGICIFKMNGNWLPFILLILGASCLSVDSGSLMRPYLMEWLLFWTPVALIAARYSQDVKSL